MYNKERFHNQLALHLGYERIVNDRRFNIKVDDHGDDVPMVMIEFVDTPVRIGFKASDTFDEAMMSKDEYAKTHGMENEIHEIIDNVHTAYLTSTKELATF